MLYVPYLRALYKSYVIDIHLKSSIAGQDQKAQQNQEVNLPNQTAQHVHANLPMHPGASQTLPPTQTDQAPLTATSLVPPVQNRMHPAVLNGLQDPGVAVPSHMLLAVPSLMFQAAPSHMLPAAQSHMPLAVLNQMHQAAPSVYHGHGVGQENLVPAPVVLGHTQAVRSHDQQAPNHQPVLNQDHKPQNLGLKARKKNQRVDPGLNLPVPVRKVGSQSRDLDLAVPLMPSLNLRVPWQIKVIVDLTHPIL